MKGQPDHYFRKAKAEGFDARSVYKLSAVDARQRLLKRGDRVLDLGASPGSWAQYTLERIGEEGMLVAVDINPAKKSMPANARFVLADCLSAEAAAALRPHAPFDVLLSDMAPKTTGVKATDEARSLDLAEHALRLCDEMLKPGGSFVAKVFEGGDFEGYLRQVRAAFSRVKLVRPEATRGRSFEIYVVGQGFRAAPAPDAREG